MRIYKFELLKVISSATQHAMPPEFGRKWETECLNTRFPLPTLLCARYSVKQFFFLKVISVYVKGCWLDSYLRK